MYNCGLRPQPASLFMTIQSHLSWTHSGQATGWTGENGFDSNRGVRKYFFFSPKRTRCLLIAKSPSQRIPWALSPGLKRPGRETDHSPSSSAELTTARCYTSITPYDFKTRYLKVTSPANTARHSISGHKILYFIHMYIRTVLIWSFICSEKKVTREKSIIQSFGSWQLIRVRIKSKGKMNVWSLFSCILNDAFSTSRHIIKQQTYE
jgi:hypothetical protein